MKQVNGHKNVPLGVILSVEVGLRSSRTEPSFAQARLGSMKLET
jgi:hypothetical protein